MDYAFGIDIGGSGIKGAPVDLKTGEFTAERIRIPTPERSTPKAVAKVCAQILQTAQISPNIPVGVTMPAPVKNDTVLFIANLDKKWAGKNVCNVFEKHVGRQVHAANDADAAGYAEAIYGAARDVKGLVIVTTLGTGIGSALIQNGKLISNTELGHLQIDGIVAETRASAAIRKAEDLSWEQWAQRLQRYYSHLEMLFSPDLFVVGGGVSRKSEKFLPLLNLKTPIVPAVLRNRAGIVGAARLAANYDS